MIYSTISVMILYSNFVLSKDFEHPEYYQRIAQGNPVVEQGAYPYLVSIQEPQRSGGLASNCGGALIQKNIVLTAAHCIDYIERYFNKSDIESFRILPNYRNSQFINGDDLTFKISSYVIHPLYEYDEPTEFQHDIAVVLLDKPDPRPNATISLPNHKLSNGASVTVMGYGLIQRDKSPSELREAMLTIIDDQICVKNFTRFEYAPDFNICAANGEGSVACSGDSGSPLVWEYENIHYVQGVVVAAAPPCGQSPFTVFVDVYSHLEFINNAISNLTRQELRSTDQIDYNQPSMYSK